MLDATERKALTISVFAASCLCFAPGQVASGGFLLAVSVLLWLRDQRLLRAEAARDEEAAQKAKAAEEQASAASKEAA